MPTRGHYSKDLFNPHGVRIQCAAWNSEEENRNSSKDQYPQRKAVYLCLTEVGDQSRFMPSSCMRLTGVLTGQLNGRVEQGT